MCRKLILLVFVIVLFAAGTTEAANYWWKHWIGDQSWFSRWNWDQGTVPLATDQASFGEWGYPSIPGPIIRAGETARCYVLWLARYGGASDVTVLTGGHLDAGIAALIGGCDYWNCWGELRVYGGSVNVGWVGLGVKGDGILDLQSGSVTMTDLFVACAYGSTGTVKLDGGTLTLDSLHMSEHYNTPGVVDGGTARIHITGGVMTVDDVDGSVATQIENLVLNGWISGYGCYDLSHVIVSWNGVDTTTVSAVPYIEVDVDILPGEDPNLLTQNVDNKGRLPIAILSSEEYDINEIDVNSISIAGVVFPVKEPKAAGDTLMIHVSRRELILALGLDTMAPGTVVPITIEGVLESCGAVMGTDNVELVARQD